MTRRCPPSAGQAGVLAPSRQALRHHRALAALAGVLLFVPLVASGGAQQRPDRSKPPALGATPQLALPAIQKRTLSNGLPVWLIEAHEVPLVQMNLVVMAGSGDDPAGKYGVASLTAAMLDEGAGKRSALEIADEIEFLGAVLTTSSSFDSSAVRLNVPVARLEAALPVMADVAVRPAFDQAELDRLRQERLTALLQARDDAAQVAPLAFSRVVFGETHRYGTGAMGTEATLKAFNVADLRAFHEARYQPSNATLVVAGDIRPDAIMPLLEKHYGSWRATATSARASVPAGRQLTERAIHLVDMPGAEQSQIRIGWVGVPRSTSDYFTLQVLNTILGGSFTSRLNQNLREKNQFSYGASSRFDMRLSAGPFFAGAGVQTDKTGDALREFFNELNAIGKVTPEELAKAKNYLALGFPSEFETIGDLAAHIEDMIVYRLPDDYFERYIANIQAVTAADVQKAAAAYIQPGRFAIVVAGDRQAIEPAIRALKLGEVRVLSVDEVLGS
jgi:predicted Zn-dependent peptidase